MAGLKTFDAFPKTEERHVKKSKKGGLSSILTYAFLLLIAWTEFGSYFGGYIDKQYSVDKDIRKVVQINMDIYVKMPCEWLHVNVLDDTNDRKIVSEELIFEDMPFFVPHGSKVNNLNKVVTPELDDILAEAIPAEFREKIETKPLLGPDGKPIFELTGCHVYGSVTVNRVAGEMQITAKGYGYRDRKRAPKDLIDFNHVVNEFSFGDFYPYIENPLDGTCKMYPNSPFSSYNYFMSVVPTFYQKLGAEIDTNQYSIREYHVDLKNSNVNAKLSTIPGIFLKYDFEPLAIIISDVRLTFLQFIVRLVAILSFVLYIASWIFRAVDKSLIFVLGPKWSLHYQPAANSQGIL
ncbi:hypothetical protein TPHA_0B00460 [Tetrapisispora phaffii CBS 4417]|uniref:Endoplasmic reticulum-Golgi intermediate compartment protein n=1 Tax=Tetrapisispora phaffii (strain ATCC 24235 / CBS 4417 / NBRC 1672 / NRRL Y-8282 / UCD 70-5) TaxID=1071381 RepID=G8BQC1_TETPH|nr:hypothetical protein TPHA_0B00460 [Tetrapisispora phaffii CBS 4417]CCE61718.1 hypothetical protein TPHA_0B00460 [Tetrapisispora phaffii CBS 4417]